jgi:hypothetical protein
MEEAPKESKGASKPPRIITHLQSLATTDGQSVTLKCTIKGIQPELVQKNQILT